MALSSVVCEPPVHVVLAEAAVRVEVVDTLRSANPQPSDLSSRAATWAIFTWIPWPVSTPVWLMATEPSVSTDTRAL